MTEPRQHLDVCRKKVTIVRGRSFGVAMWEGDLEARYLNLLHDGVLPTIIAPDRLIYYVPNHPEIVAALKVKP